MVMLSSLGPSIWETDMGSKGKTEGFNFAQANFPGIKEVLETADWSILNDLSVEDAWNCIKDWINCCL